MDKDEFVSIWEDEGYSLRAALALWRTRNISPVEYTPELARQNARDGKGDLARLEDAATSLITDREVEEYLAVRNEGKK